MNENILIKPSVRQEFDRFLRGGRILFLSAPCGFGKTALADSLLHEKKVLRLNAGAPDFAVPTASQGWDMLLIDDLHLLQDEPEQLALCELIRANPERRFVLLSRGAAPGGLMAFQYTGLMRVLSAEALFFDLDDIRSFFAARGGASGMAASQHDDAAL